MKQIIGFVRHKEQRENEVFLGNVDKISNYLLCLKTLRLGKQAYDVYGDKIPLKDGIKPLFINKSEDDKFNNIMLEEMRKH